MFVDVDILQSLTNPQYALELGKAAEHLVCADLILRGYRAFLSDQGLPYDIIVDFNDRLIRLQVKAAAFPRNSVSKKRKPNHAYLWNVRQRGKKNQRRLSSDDCDVIALVGISDLKIAYVPITACSQTVSLRSSFEPGKMGYTFEELRSFENAVNGIPVSLALDGRKCIVKRNGQFKEFIS